MKWYKHDSNANSDAKMRRVRLKYGMEGYGLYWYCLELIAQNVDKHNLSFELEHDAEIIAADTGIHVERVQEMMTYMVNLGLFEQQQGIITCRKMLKRLDQSMTSDANMRKLIESAKENHDLVMTESGNVMQEQNRTDKNRTEQKGHDGIGIPLKDGSFYYAQPEDLSNWAKTYPKLSIEAQLRAIATWNDANPDKRKTARGIKKHIVGWFGRQNDKSASQDADAESRVVYFNQAAK